MQTLFNRLGFILIFIIAISCGQEKASQRTVSDFNQGWLFSLTDSTVEASDPSFNDSSWRALDLPHDWSIEGAFNKDNPAGVGGGALPGGIGWYRKAFKLQKADSSQLVFIDFDGIYCNSEVWINGSYLGKRPNGYISFRYELTPYLNYGDIENVISVKVNNDQQPNSRWYSGSGIYRNVWLVKTNKIYVDQWGSQVTTPTVTEDSALVHLKINLQNRLDASEVSVSHKIVGQDGSEVAIIQNEKVQLKEGKNELEAQINVDKPRLWSVEDPFMYKVITSIEQNDKIIDTYSTSLGIRYYEFNAETGFSLNGKHLKIRGVCNHHDLGALGAAINTRALERQLEIMKGMGVNGIRTAHNPPAPELLQLCDSMGFIVMDEAFDMWAKKKVEFDYSQEWDLWHKRDLEDLIKRDRNHPSIFIWSIGNEILEQWDSTGTTIAGELASIVKSLDDRPITSALNDPQPSNKIYQSKALDLVGFNYHHQDYEAFPSNFPGEKFIATETTSALATRGHYDMPSDSIRRWPIRWDLEFTEGNADNTVSAYDNVSAPWGSTHEETLKIIEKHDYLSGMYIWTGFDYIGEPTPYTWPSRSSYFGVVDLAGFPKDTYYLYKSVWTQDTVLHVFPHWNWTEGKTVDVWAYYNQADEAELFLNGESKGIMRKQGDDMHVMWRLNYEPGTVKMITRKNGQQISAKEIKTAGQAAIIKLQADRSEIMADNKDLSFVTVSIHDADGNLVPNASDLIQFKLEGEGQIVGVDNGDPTSMESFKAEERKAFNGLALVIIKSTSKTGELKLTATAKGLESTTINLQSK
ncbi:beta-galactosidase GalB [Fulvivirga ligni]|uniref:beta-galactosidase GalB n=1 Tax=Fulvivirga ligni TaxID=2904246 RepID=UPI001F1C9170|nr:beta-galactosidase GalB [Fulvivirga ligni]UII23711.1 DUF4982 domain-containing protein [Fulvivirga ligni]